MSERERVNDFQINHDHFEDMFIHASQYIPAAIRIFKVITSASLPAVL